MYRPITHVSFVMTEECNLRCKYCFYKKNPKRTDWETSKRLIDWLVEQGANSKRFHIQFFGGEPMLEWELITRIIDYTKKYPQKQWAFGMTTNGTLFTEERFQYCLDNRIDILFSIDGTPEAHDMHRVQVNGEGSFKLLEPWIERLAKSGICDVARLTYTPDTLPMLYESIKYLKERGFKYVAPTPAIDSYRSFTKEDFKEWDRQYAKIAKDYKDTILSGTNPGANYFEKCWRQILVDQKLGGPCGAAKAFVGVSWDGGIYPCHRFVQWPEWRLGDVWNGITNNKLREELLNYDINNPSHPNSKCVECDNMFCGGTCLAANYENNKSIYEPKEDGCILQKKQFDLAKELYDELKDTEQFKRIYGKYKTENKQANNFQNNKQKRIDLLTIDKRLENIEKMLFSLSKVVLDIADGAILDNNKIERGNEHEQISYEK